MEAGIEIPICPPPWEQPSDVIPMLVVLAAFVLLGWLFRRWRKKRKAGKHTP